MTTPCFGVATRVRAIGHLAAGSNPCLGNHLGRRCSAASRNCIASGQVRYSSLPVRRSGERHLSQPANRSPWCSSLARDSSAYPAYDVAAARAIHDRCSGRRQARNDTLAALGTTPADTEVAVRIEIASSVPKGSLTARVPQVVFDRKGQQSTIALLATFADGNVLDATASSRVTYASSNPSVATVDDNGFLRGVGSGVAAITARYTLRGREPPGTRQNHRPCTAGTGCPRARSISVSSRWGRPPRRT